MAKRKDQEIEEVTEEKSITSDVWFSTGATLLDIVVGGGRGLGYEAGQVVNIPSNSGAGKTGHINEVIANAYHTYGSKFKWIYDQTREYGNTFDTKTLYGLDVIPKDPEKQVASQTIEEALANIVMFTDKLKSDEFGVYALDSLDGTMSQETEDIAEEHVEAQKKGKEYTKGTYQGSKPKFLSSIFFPTIVEKARNKNCLILIVSQLRDNVGAGSYAPKDRISNGRALQFYCDTRLWFEKKQNLGPDEDRPIGVVTSGYTTKTRGPMPYRNCLFITYHTYGIDNVGSNIDFLYNLRTPDRGDLRKAEAKALLWHDTIRDTNEVLLIVEGEIQDKLASGIKEDKARKEIEGKWYRTREELIAYIEDAGLEKELTSRVIAQWNRLEEEAKKEILGRKKRFS